MHPGSDRMHPGSDRMYAGGGYAEYCVAPQQQVIELPEQLSLAQGAAVPENYWTVWATLVAVAAAAAAVAVAA